MANRSYLYSSNRVPGPVKDGYEELELASLAEFPYDIPVAYRLLMSANPRVCHSVIWDSEEPIALAAEYDAGLARLAGFLAQIDLPQAQPLIQETLDFLGDPDNKQAFFVLEAGELFAMGEDGLAQQNLALLAELKDAELHAAQALASLREVSGQGEEALAAELRMMGLGSWSNTLYYDAQDE